MVGNGEMAGRLARVMMLSYERGVRAGRILVYEEEERRDLDVFVYDEPKTWG